jgi:hypothetical protein
MRRVNSRQVVTKQLLQQQMHEKHITWGAAGSAASGCSTPLRGTSPPASQTGAMPCVGGAAETARSCSREMAALKSASSSSRCSSSSSSDGLQLHSHEHISRACWQEQQAHK